LDISCRNYLGNVKSFFYRLFRSSHFNFSDNDISKFIEANGELIHNIFQHSDSWGLGSIHANPTQGTTVSWHDIGLGIKESLNSSPKVGIDFDKFTDDYKAMKWAITEGNSSKEKGNGAGLNVVEQFVLEKKGYIDIRSGNSLLRKTPLDKIGEKYWNHKIVPWFPGTQINFFIPCLS
jgi:hypothetical protein